MTPETLIASADWVLDLTGTREDEEVIISAVMLGQFTPAELNIPRRCFTGYRVAIWQSLEAHYGDTQAGVVAPPAIKAIELFMAHTLRVRGDSLAEELQALRMARPYVADEFVAQAVARLLERQRARELADGLARLSVGLYHGTITARQAREWMGEL